MKKFTITLLPLLLITAIALAWLSNKQEAPICSSVLPPIENATLPLMFSKLHTKAIEAKAFAEKHHFNSKFYFLIDISLPSNRKRFFVYDFEKDTIQNAGLVTHGRCNEYWLEGRKYGNTPGCGCTSLGKYKIGNAYNGRFGLAFKLYGLDTTNDKAFERFVVLHAHSCVPESEVADEICQSDGCPTVAPGFLKQLEPMINQSQKPVLLWIVE
ncbi:MAG: murein L,D-transpeptidase catalytic domain-containing protein [Flavisolibacter sp.]